MGVQGLGALRLAAVCGGAGQAVAGSAGALLAGQLSGSMSVAGLPQALLVAGAALSALGVSALNRRRGRRLGLAVGMLIAVTGCVVVVLGADAHALSGVLAGKLLLGAGNTSVMLGRYAAADLASEALRPRAMADVLVATTLGAVAGPNLLGPAADLAGVVGLPRLCGPYVVGAALFCASAAALLTGLPSVRPVVSTSTRPPLGEAGRAGLLVLATANLVMVAVMTMAPVHLHAEGSGLTAIGLVISAHIAGMFAPSPLSGRLVQRAGPARTSAVAVALVALAAGLAAAAAGRTAMLVPALVLVGVAWNVALVAGSTLLTRGIAPAQRPSREGWGEVGMGVAAAGGGLAAGPMVMVGGYSTLALAAAAAATVVLPWLVVTTSRRQAWTQTV